MTNVQVLYDYIMLGKENADYFYTGSSIAKELRKTKTTIRADDSCGNYIPTIGNALYHRIKLRLFKNSRVCASDDFFSRNTCF